MFKTQDENWAFDVREMDDGAGHKDHNRILFPALRKNSIEVLDSVRSH